MSRLRTLAVFVCATLAVANTAYAGPFTDRGKLGDLMMAMSAAYAWGMTVMEKDWDGTIQLAESVIASQLVVEGIKKLEIEQRPNGRDWKSLPSGHAAGAFSGAMFVHKRYGWRPAIVPYVMAGITGWSRVDARAHYWHDIAAGAAVSALFTWLLVDRYLPKGVEVSAGPESMKVGFRTKF